MSIVAGIHVPFIPLLDVVGKGPIASPKHIGSIGVNVGVTVGIISTVRVVPEAHCPASGVKVYVVVILGSKAGLQVPVKPSFDAVGSTIFVPSHTGVIELNVDVVSGIIPIVIVV